MFLQVAALIWKKAQEEQKKEEERGISVYWCWLISLGSQIVQNEG